MNMFGRLLVGVLMRIGGVLRFGMLADRVGGKGWHSGSQDERQYGQSYFSHGETLARRAPQG